jgi:hypothetical protein
VNKYVVLTWQYCAILAPKIYKATKPIDGNINALLREKARKMEEKKFRSVSLRDALVKQVEDFIAEHPLFVTDNPEYNSVAGFIDRAARLRLQELKNQLDSGKPLQQLRNVEAEA